MPCRCSSSALIERGAGTGRRGQGPLKEVCMSREDRWFAGGVLLLSIGANALCHDVTNSPTIRIERAARFVAPDGGEAVASAGTYRVEALEPSQLLLSPLEGKGFVLIQATATRHEDDVDSPVALTLSSDGGTRFVVSLSLPRGTRLEATGVYTDVQSRAVASLPPSTAAKPKMPVATVKPQATPTPLATGLPGGGVKPGITAAPSKGQAGDKEGPLRPV